MARRFNGHVVCLDDFSRPGTPTWEHERFIVEVLEPLRRGSPATYSVWRWDSPEPTGRRTVPPGGLVLVEGVSALTLAVVERVGRWWDLSVWVDADEKTRRQRILRRDGHCLDELWEEHWWPSERRYFDEERPLDRADFVLRDSAVGGPR